MNVERMKELRDYLAALPPEKINMGQWVGWYNKTEAYHDQTSRVGGIPSEPECGTVACIAGHTVCHFTTPEERAKKPHNTTIMGLARQILGLTEAEAEYLFLARTQINGTETHNLNWLYKDDVIAALDKSIELGRVPRGVFNS